MSTSRDPEVILIEALQVLTEFYRNLSASPPYPEVRQGSRCIQQTLSDSCVRPDPAQLISEPSDGSGVPLPQGIEPTV